MTNSQGKTESPKGVEADLWSKPDETSTNEKIKELCPIVITTIDCRPTKFKDANGDIRRAALQNGNARAGFAGAARGSSTAAISTGSALYIGLTSSVRGSALR